MSRESRTSGSIRSGTVSLTICRCAPFFARCGTSPARLPGRCGCGGIWETVAVLVPAAVLEGVLRPGLPLRGLSILVTVGPAATLLWRRIRPLLMVAVAFGVLGLLLVLTAGAIPQMYTGAYVLILPYALFRWGSGREAVIGSAITAGKAGLSALPSVSRPSDAVAGSRCPALGDGPGGGVPVPGWGEDA